MNNLVLKSLDDLAITARILVKELKLENNNKINCIAFYGEMGAGKTTLIKAICNELGVSDTTSSPTFSIINEYISESGNSIFHFDFYRLNSASEAYDFGYEEYFYSGHLCMIEWPEKIEELLPDLHYKIKIEVDKNDQRILSIVKTGGSKN